MSCYHPLQAYQHKYLKGSVQFKDALKQNNLYQALQIPCGQCIGCRLERARQWAMRCMYEASLYEDNCFITLTYATEHLPKNSSLERRDFQLFMKRLRKHFSDVTIRNFYCGEYGGKLGRPHFHAILFNLDFHDKKHYKEVKSGAKRYNLYTSETLSKIWGKGICIVGEANYETAGYVAQYCLKKKTGEQAKTHYDYVDPVTLEVIKRKPEFSQASLGKAIGKGWYEKYKSDVFPADEVIINERSVKPPKLFMQLLELDNAALAEQVKAKRAEAALEAQQKDIDAFNAVPKRKLLAGQFFGVAFGDFTREELTAEFRRIIQQQRLNSVEQHLQQRRLDKEKCVLAKLRLRRKRD